MSSITKIEAGDHAREVYMPYAMSTILDRALPDVRDGLKPVHRRILYSMYKSGITHNKDRAKTVEPVSETMKIHHHGNTSIEDAIALMTEQNESLLHPFVDGEGAFGKVYSKDSPSAARYTYARLNKFSEEFFKDIDKNILQMIGEDKEHLQPIVLSSDYPSLLIKNNSGIACGEACDFPSFNLIEICNATKSYIKNKDIDLFDYIKAMDFSTGAYLLYDKKALEKIYTTGQGSIILRAKYKYDKENNCIDIIEIPYSTTVDVIVSKISELMKKNNVFKAITDVRDETGFNNETQKEEMKITIDVKKNTDINVLMANLFKSTPLQTSYSANMNCLVDYEPKVLGIKAILDEWIKFKQQCIMKGIKYDVTSKSNKLHVLEGLEKVLLDIDKAIEIIKKSNENEIILTLCNYFNIDETQANEVSNMKLRNINKDYIIKQIQDIQSLREEILRLKNTLEDIDSVNDIIIKGLERIRDTYGKPRKTELLFEDTLSQEISADQLIEQYNCRVIYSKEGYIKKLLKSSDQQKLKDNDEIIGEISSTNKSTLLFFTNKQNRYRLPCHQLDTCTPSSLGTYIPNILNLEPNEQVIKVFSIEEERGYILSVFANGKLSKIDIKSYLSNYTKLNNCYSNDSELIDINYIEKDVDVLLLTEEGKMLIIDSSQVNSKGSRSSQGNTAINTESKVIATIIDVNKDMNFNINTEKGKEITFYLDDVAPTGKNTEERTLYTYCYGNVRNKGNYIYYNKTDKIINFTLNK